MNPLERKALVFLLDLGVFSLLGFVAFLIGAWIAPGDISNILGQLPWLYLSGGILFAVALFNDCYSIESLEKRDKFLKRWFVAWVVSCSAYFFIFLLLSRQSQAISAGFVVPRLLPVVFLLLVLTGTPTARIVCDNFMHRSIRPLPVLLVGKSSSCEYFIQEIRQAGYGNWDIIGQLDPSIGRFNGLQGLKETQIVLPELAQFIRRMGVSEIILTDPSGLSNDALAGLLDCFENGVEILSLEQAFEKTMDKIPVEHLGEGWLPTTFWSHVRVPLFYRACKRIIDLTVGGILLVGSLPIMSLAVVLIKITSPGPAIYRQQRIGLHGRAFVIRKFRTMLEQRRDADQRWAERKDSRITPLGRILRKTRIDELPQLLNVLCGEMSLVGPRPEQPVIAHKLEQEIPFFRARSKVLPGITGWAQVKYRYGNSVDDSRIKLEYDLYYIKNRSILLELIILIKTVRIVLGFKGY